MGWQDHAPTAGGAGDGSRSWRQPTLGTPAPEPHHNSGVIKARSKKFFATTLAGISAVVFLFLVSLFFKGCSSTEFFISTTLEYEADKAGAIPPNWMAEADRQILESLENSGRVSRLTVNSFAKETDFQKQLKDLFPKTSQAKKKDTACVIYLSAHAVLEPLLDNPSKEMVKVADADVILLASSDDFGPKTIRVRLSEVWNALKNLPPEQKKLLLLDLCRLQGRWRLGIYDNFVMEGIQAAVQREKIPNLFVMTACSSGENSWVSPHLGESGQSVFAHFVARGLSGEADRSNGKSDGKITVRELFQFVHSRVNDWVERNRDSTGQHPRLFASDVDVTKAIESKVDTTFSVATVSTRKSAEPKASAKTQPASTESIDQSKNQLFTLWKRRQSLEQPKRNSNALYHVAPVGFRALTQRLMRAEEFLIHHHTAQATSELEKAEALCARLEKHAQQGHFAAASFSANERFLNQLADRFGLGASPSLPQATASAPAAAQDIDLPDEHLKVVLSRAQEQHGMPSTLSKTDLEDLQNRLVKLRQLAESVAFGHHTVLPWLRQDLAKAEQLRREAEDNFFVTDTKADRERRELSNAGKSSAGSDRSKNKADDVRELVDKATEEFQRLQGVANTFEEAQFTLNRACATLPEWLAFASGRSADQELQKLRAELMNEYHRPIGNNAIPKPLDLANVGLASKDSRGSSLNELDKDILSVSLEAIELRRLLPIQFSAVNAEQFDAMKLSTEKLKGLLAEVQQHFQREADLLRNTSQPQPIHWRLIRDLLQSPTLEPDTRRDLFGKLIHLRLDKDAIENQDFKEPPQNDRQTALWQMLCSIHVLSLAPAPTGMASDKLWNEWHSVSIEESRVSAEPVIKFSRTLRKHWIGHLAEAREECRSWQLESRDLARNSLEQKDLSARILFPSDAINLQEQPTRNFERFLIAELLLDSSERYLDDYWKDWYEKASKSCLVAATRLSDRMLAKDQRRIEELSIARGEAKLLLEAAPVVFGTQKTASGSVRVRHGKDLPIGLATAWLAYKDDNPRVANGQPLAELCNPRSVGLSLRSKDSSNEVGRLSIQLPQGANQATAPTCQPSQLAPRVFFRDHTWSEQATALFNPCKPEGTLIRLLASPSTSAIRVNGEDRKSVVFVLDASGSMAPDGNEAKADRWSPAKGILLDVLNDLQRNNRAANAEPHQVELIVYGHRDPATQVEDRANVKTEIPMSALTDQVIAQVRAKLERFEPFGSTPLLTAVEKACQSLTKTKTPGTIIVITDGVPNDGARWDPQALNYNYAECRPVLEKRKLEIRTSLENARTENREIELQVIGLGFQEAAPPNELAARKELEQLVSDANRRDGQFHRAATFQELRGKLNLTTGARHFFVGEFDRLAGKLFDGPLNQPLSDLPCGKCRIAFAYSDRLKEGLAIELKGGELFDFQLLPDGKLKHVHPLALRSTAGFRRAQNRAGYRFGNAQSFRFSEGRAEFVVGIQNLSTDLNNKIAYTERPDRLVVEIWPKDQPLKKLPSMTYQIEPGKSDPTWTIHVDDWKQSDTEAHINAYASWEPVPHDELLVRSTNLTWPKTVDLPISKNDRLRFQVEVLTPPNDRVDLEDLLEVRLRLENSSDAPQLSKDWRHLAYLQVQLLDEGQPIPHLDGTAEVISSENEIRWKFSNLPRENFSTKRLKIAMTTWYTFEQHALTLEQPLAIKAE